MVQKWARRNSFFNFFNPPRWDPNVELDPKRSGLLEAHFEIGLHLKETFVPRAGYYFLSEGEGGGATRQPQGHARRGSLHITAVVNNNNNNVAHKLVNGVPSSLNSTVDGSVDVLQGISVVRFFFFC